MRIFRNKLLIILYVCLLAFCSVWVFFKIQERDIVNQLNNHNLSQNAYEVVMKGTTSLEDINNKIFLWDTTAKPDFEIEEIKFPTELLDKAKEGNKFIYENGTYKEYK